MSQNQKLMTTGMFAKKSGIPTAKVSEMIRAGRIKAKKVSGRWQIDQSQLNQKAVLKYGKSAPASKRVAAKKTAPKAKIVSAAASQKSYTISEFAAMTYLTEKGVTEWLKSGRLKGQVGSGGKGSVAASNLEVADISRLVR